MMKKISPTQFAPWLTLAILLTLSWLLPNRTAFSAQAAQRKTEIAAAMDDVPLIIGRWVGAEVPVPSEAQKLLRPNAILSRTYHTINGPAIGMLVVHCGDARDMIGHYPPICYPSSGWMEVPVPEADGIELDAAGRPMPVRTYCFRRLRDQATEDVIRIFNAFVLPDGTVTRDIDDINRQSERLAVSIQGVAQVQIISAQDLSLDRAAACANELLGGMQPLLEALRVGNGGAHGAN